MKHLFPIVVGVIVAVIAGWSLVAPTPTTAAELYQDRCTRCHALPDVSRYPASEIPQLIDYMRRANGARVVVSDKDAQTIADYLMAQAR